MALPVISTDDFTGFVNVSQDTYMIPDFQDTIDDGIKSHLRCLLGDAAFIDIRDNARAVYTSLFAGVDWVNTGGDEFICDSLTDVLKMLIYADHAIEGHTVETNVGIVSNINENSIGPSGGVQAGKAVKRLSRAAEYWATIKDFIEFYRVVTQEILSVDLTDPLNPICTVESATFLEDGNNIEILGVSYTAASVTATTFTIASAVGSSFLGEDAVWKPLEKVKSDLGDITVGFA